MRKFIKPYPDFRHNTIHWCREFGSVTLTEYGYFDTLTYRELIMDYGSIENYINSYEFKMWLFLTRNMSKKQLNGKTYYF